LGYKRQWLLFFWKIFFYDIYLIVMVGVVGTSDICSIPSAQFLFDKITLWPKIAGLWFI